jgi:hypothetical protein
MKWDAYGCGTRKIARARASAVWIRQSIQTQRDFAPIREI